ncbi:hypothetical protein Tco_1239888 [Tanacetum coccineum]
MERKLEEMESANHDNFGKVMEILKEYCEVKKEKKKELEEENKIVKSYSPLSSSLSSTDGGEGALTIFMPLFLVVACDLIDVVCLDDCA